MAEQKSSSDLPGPLQTATSALRKVPGAEMVGRATEGALNAVGAVSPRGRRLAVYTGAGILGVVGLVEWPVALTGAAVAWLTQQRPEHPERSGQAANGSRSAKRTTSAGGRKTTTSRKVPTSRKTTTSRRATATTTATATTARRRRTAAAAT
ncbi:hypothetical protein [Streptomyces colonosanans]|uniref:hypothetical protein n=1 Tax=Streptomyces colonosanans TaxID=1428652 RepID=UPI0009A10FC3|nr:hypothetical protein [Streptomyces colonosanans]